MTSFLRDNFIHNQHNIENTSGSKPRLEYIDLAKGVCIILVVFLHIGIEAYDLPGLQILRMPLYFFLSGLFFKRYNCFTTFLKKKINNLIIPCIFFEICYVIPKVLNGTISAEESIQSIFLFKIINGPLWFLCSLFSVNILFYWIDRFNKEWLIFSLIFICAFSGYMMSIHSYNLYYIGSSLSAMPLFYAGSVFHRQNLLPQGIGYGKSLLSRCLCICLAIITFISVIISYQHFNLPNFHISYNSFSGNPPLFYILSLISITCFIIICSMIRWLPIVSYCGRYSIIILGLHQILQFNATTPLYWITGIIPDSFGLFIMTILLSWLLIPFFKKYFPYFTAQKNVFDWLEKRMSLSTV